MKKAVFLLSVLCLLSPAFGDTHTSVSDGLWSAAATWNPAAVPADGDTVNIDTSGEDIIFDVDQSAFVGLAGLTIASGASLTASTTAGAYVLKMNADLTLNGTIQAGTSVAVPYPSTCTFTINFSSGNYQIVGSTTGRIYLYDTEPTYKFVRLSATEASGQTVLSYDGADPTNGVTGDIWAIGDTVLLVDVAIAARDIQATTIAAAGIAATTITVNDALDSDNAAGAFIILLRRNIRIINSTATDGVFRAIRSSDLYCEIDNSCAVGIGSSTSQNITFGGVCHSSLYLDVGTQNLSISGVICRGSIALTGSNIVTLTNTGLIAGVAAAGSSMRGVTILGEVAGCDYGFSGIVDLVIDGASLHHFGTSTAYAPIMNSNILLLTNSTLQGNYDLSQVTSGKIYNTLFSGSNEFYNYNSALWRAPYHYVESFDHDQVVNAYKAWCLGGIVSSQTASPPTTETRYAVYYQHACETNLYPTFHQYLTTVSPGAAIEVEGYIQIPAIDLTSYPPKLQIIDAFADPLVDSTQTALDQDQPVSVDGTVTTWQPVDVIWANTGESPRQVYVRMIAYSHDVSNHNINMVWSVASYQDQIASLYDSLIPIRTDVATADTPTSFTLTGGQAATNAYRYNTLAIQDATDGHWEQRKILSWTSGRVTTVDHAFSFTPAAGDLANILSVGYGEDDLIIAGTVPDATSTANSIKLGTNASSTNDIYNENLIVLTGGTGAGQARLVTDYFGATKRAAVRNPWVITPDATTTYRIAPFSGILLANTGVCNGGTVNSITLRTPAPATADLYNGHTIFLSGGTGMGQARLITDYSAALVATVSPNWDVTPVVDDTVYIVLPVGLGTIYSDITAIKAVTDIMEAVNSTVSVVGDANSFTIANTGDINDVNDAYNGMTVYVEDATTGDWEARLIDNWETGRVITVDADFTFTPEVGDIVIIWGISYFPTSVYNGLPLPPEGETITVDRRVAPTGGTIGGTRTLDAEGDDPP